MLAEAGQAPRPRLVAVAHVELMLAEAGQAGQALAPEGFALSEGASGCFALPSGCCTVLVLVGTIHAFGQAYSFLELTTITDFPLMYD